MFYGPRGQLLCEGRWQPPELAEEPVEALVEQHRALGIEPDEETAAVQWRRAEDVRPASGSPRPKRGSEPPPRLPKIEPLSVPGLSSHSARKWRNW